MECLNRFSEILAKTNSLTFLFLYFRCNTQGTRKAVSSFAKNFGRSLFADYSDHYMSDFVLHGTSCTEFTRKMNKDLQQAVQVKICIFMIKALPESLKPNNVCLSNFQLNFCLRTLFTCIKS